MMTKIKFMIALVLPFVAASAAYAGPFSWFPIKPRTPVVAPEIDPGMALTGLTLLAGGLAVIRGRRGKK